MTTEPSAGEELCALLHAKGVLPDWYLLSAAHQIALDETAAELIADCGLAAEKAELETELEDLKKANERRDELEDERGLTLVENWRDPDDRDEEPGFRVYYGAREVFDVTSVSFAWKAPIEDGAEPAKVVDITIDTRTSVRVPTLDKVLVENMREAGIELTILAAPEPPAPVLPKGPAKGRRRR